MMRAMLMLVAALAGAAAPLQTFPPQSDPHTFYLALLSKGPAWTADSTPAQRKLQDLHLAHLGKLAAAGRAAIAGPLDDDSALRGLIVLKAASLDEARSFEAADPAVAASRLTFDVLPFTIAGNWFTFGAIPADVSMRQFVIGFVTIATSSAGAPDESAALVDARLSYLWNLRRTGSVVMTGTFSGVGPRRALVVYAVDDLKKARDLADADPAVASGHFSIELHPWFAADGIMILAR